jgi:hypothetical protein
MAPGLSLYPSAVWSIWPRPMYLFCALQAADVLTTIVFRAMGVAESNPVAGFLMDRFGNLSGLLILKSAAIAIGLTCDITSHPIFVRRINAIYCVIIVINYLTICNALRS